MSSSRPLPGTKPALQARSQETLLKLLAAAQEELVAVGGDDVTLSSVASRAGVSVATVYRRFGSKEQLLLAVKHRALGRLETDVTSRLAAPTNNLAAVVTAFVDEISHWMSESGRMLPELFSTQGRIQLPATTDATDDGTVSRLLAAFRHAAEPHAREIRRADAETATSFAARNIIASGMNQALSSWFSSDVPTWSSWAHEIDDMTLAYLTTPAKPTPTTETV